jgi:phage gpG-like protein
VKIGSFNVPYAAVHEFGFRGTVQVPAHSRRMTQAFGRPVDPRQVAVQAHSMRMNIRARPYLRPAIKTTRTFVLDTLRAALQFAKAGR